MIDHLLQEIMHSFLLFVMLLSTPNRFCAANALLFIVVGKGLSVLFVKTLFLCTLFYVYVFYILSVFKTWIA